MTDEKLKNETKAWWRWTLLGVSLGFSCGALAGQAAEKYEHFEPAVAGWDRCLDRLKVAKEEADYACMAKLDPSGCVPELHDLMAGTYHRTPPGSTDCSRTADGGVWSW